MTQEQLLARLAQLEAQNQALLKAQAEANKPRALTCKVSEKGALSLYGINSRFPVTLYKRQWLRILNENRDMILAFIEANALALQDEKPVAAKA